MQNMQKVHKHGFTAAAALVALAIALASTGCATSRPYTKDEKWALGHAFVGQIVGDVGTTAYALHKYDNIEEGNGIWGDQEDGDLIATMILTKVALIGCVYLIGEWKPDWRTPMLNTVGGIGDVFAAANLYTTNEYGEQY